MAQPLMPDTVEAIGNRVAAGETGPAIARALNMTRSAVSGVIFRLRKVGDPRVPPAGTGVVTTKQAQQAALADAFADGAATLTEAARIAGMAWTTAQLRWDEICAGLGWQAA